MSAMMSSLGRGVLCVTNGGSGSHRARGPGVRNDGPDRRRPSPMRHVAASSWQFPRREETRSGCRARRRWSAAARRSFRSRPSAAIGPRIPGLLGQPLVGEPVSETVGEPLCVKQVARRIRMGFRDNNENAPTTRSSIWTGTFRPHCMPRSDSGTTSSTCGWWSSRLVDGDVTADTWQGPSSVLAYRCRNPSSVKRTSWASSYGMIGEMAALRC